MTRKNPAKSPLRAAIPTIAAAAGLLLALGGCESTDSTGKPATKRSSVTKQSVTKSAPNWDARPTLK